jgi:hypothetical protein
MRRLLCRLGLHDAPPWEPHWQMAPGATLYFGLTRAVECVHGCGARWSEFCDPDSHWEERHPNRSEVASPDSAQPDRAAGEGVG